MATRVNKNFLIILTSVLLGTGVVLFAGSKLLFNKDASALVAAGDASLASGDAQQAILQYKRAVGKQPGDPDIIVKLGDALNSIAGESSEYLMQARGAWTSALTLNPAHINALQRLTDSYADELQVSAGSSERYQQLNENAGRLAAAQAARNIDNKAALARQHLAVVQPWISGLPVMDKDADASISALMRLAPSAPADAEIGSTIAAAMLHKSGVARQHGDDEEAEKELVSAVASMDASLKGQEKNVAMLARANRIFEVASVSENDATLKAEYLKKADEALDSAIALAKPDDERYFEVIRAAAGRAARQKNLGESQKILRDLLAKKPLDLNVRLTVAAELAKDPANRDEAIGILSEPVKATAEQNKGAKALVRKYMEASLNIELAKLLVQKVRAADNAVARADAMTELDKRYAQAEAFYTGDNVAMLRLKAERLQLRGDGAGAIQTFLRAISLMGPNFAEGDDLKNEAARALLAANQTSTAKKLLDEIALKHETHLPTRMLQFDIAMRENSMEEAKRILDIIDKLPDTGTAGLPLHVEYLKKTGDPKAADQYFAKLMEENREQRLIKAQAAGLLEKTDEVVRLAALNVKADPKDATSRDLLVRGLLATKHNDEAKKVVDEAIAREPQNLALREMRQRIDLVDPAVSPKQRYDKEVELLTAREKDPFRREVLLGELARRFDNVDEAAKHYAAAAAINPKDPVVISRRFDMALARQKFDEAQTYLKPLIDAAGDAAPIIEAKFALAKGDAPAALKFARELTKSRAEFADSWVLLGQSQQALRQYADAVNAYAQARERQAGNFDAVRGLVECYYALGQPVEAGRIIDDGRGLFPDNALFKDMDLVYEVNYGDPEKAIPDREQQYKDNPKQPIIALVLADAYEKAASKKYRDDKAKQEDFFKKAQGVLAKGGEEFPQDNRFQTALANLSLAKGDFAGGEARLKAYAAQDALKARPEPMLVLADYYGRSDKPELLESALREALARSKNQPEIRERLVAALAIHKDYDKALKELDGQTDRAFIIERIKVLIAAGRAPEAEAALKDAIDKHHDDSFAYRGMLIEFYVKNSRFPEALAQIEPVLKDDPKNTGALYARAVVRMRQPKRDINGAIDDLKRIRSADPLNLDAAALLSDAYNAAGLPDKSLAELEDLTVKAPGNPAFRRKLLERYMQKRDFDSALRLAKEAEGSSALAGDPYWPRWAARAYAAEADFPDAISAMQRALHRTPQSANLDVFHEYLDLLASAKQYKALFEASNEVVGQGRKDWWLLMNRGIARAMSSKDTPGALTDFDAALAEAGKETDPHAAEQVVSAITSTVGADAALQRVQGRAKEDPRWRVVSAILFEAKKDHAAALQELDQAIAETAGKQTPPAVRLVVLSAAAGYYQGASPEQTSKAQAAYEELLKLAPNDIGALNNLAVLLSEDIVPPDIARATAYAKNAYDLVRQSQPMNTHVVDTYAWMLVLNNQAKDAIRMLMDVVDAEPTLIDARYHLAEAHLQLKEPQAAQDQLNAALAAIKNLSDDQQNRYAKMKTRLDDDVLKAKAMLQAVSSASNAGTP